MLPTLLLLLIYLAENSDTSFWTQDGLEINYISSISCQGNVTNIVLNRLV